MALKGDLASVDLAQVFQMLVMNQKVGILSIQAPRAWKALYFDHRGTTLYFNQHVLVDSVLLRMTRMGRLSKESVREARDHSIQRGCSIVDSLLAGGYLTEDEVREALGTEIEEEIYDLFFWRDAGFEFFEGATSVNEREGLIDDRFFFNADSMVMEAARRIDEWSYIQELVPGPLEVFRVTRDGEAADDLDDASLAVLDAVDGRCNIARLTELTGLPVFQVYKTVAVLLDEGLVEDVPLDELVESAKECEREGRLHDSINLYEKVLSCGHGIPGCHAAIAAVYEKVREFELAGYHHKCVAEFNAQNERHKEAVATLQHVVEMLPTDLAARERLVELTVGRSALAGPDFDPTRQGKELVELYLEIGEIDRVRAILERLLRDNPYDVELKKSLVNVHSRAGDTRRVIELYESMAEDLVQQRKPIEAVKFLQKILMLDRNRKDVSERIKSLYEMDERRRNRRRSLVALGALLVCLIGVGAVWFVYEQHARDRLAELEPVVADLIESESYVQAAARIQEFIDEYPLTIVSRDAAAELARIDSQRAKHEASQENIRKQLREQKERHRQAYRAAWMAFKANVDNRDLDEALRQLDLVQEYLEKAGEAEDFRWAEQEGLDRERRDLEAYMSRAIELDREAWEKYDVGDWRGARAKWVELVTKFNRSETAQTARLPVYLDTRPAGAQIYYRGQRLVEERDSGAAKVTPAIVRCQPGREELFELRLDGFKPEVVRLEAMSTDVARIVMTAVPAQRLPLSDSVRTTPAGHEGYVGVGLRGGKVAFLKLGEPEPYSIVQLPGLDEMDGAMTVTADRAFFRTKEGQLEAYSLQGGQPRWRTRLDYVAVTDPLVRDHRLFVVDEQGQLLGYDTGSGQQLWPPRALGGHPAAAPTIDGRLLFIGLQVGGIRVIDVNDGRPYARHERGGRIATPVLHHNGAVVFGTEKGEIVALRREGWREAWVYPLGRASDSGALIRLGESVIAVDGDSKLVKLGIRDGKLEASLSLPGKVVAGPVANDRFVVLTVRRSGAEGDYDTLLALSRDDLSMQWQYGDGGEFAAGPGVAGDAVLLPDAKGELLLFR